METSAEAHTKELQELSARLQQEYQDKLLEEQQRHREEIEKLQVCILSNFLLYLSPWHWIFWYSNLILTKAQLDEYIRRLEETERSLRTAEAKIAERDERIIEVERLLDCMGKVKKKKKKNTWE